jgi:DNA modification methylase
MTKDVRKLIIDEKELSVFYDTTKEIENKIICGETLSILKKLPDKSVQMIVTSPSYFLGKSYEKDHKFEEYLEEHRKIIEECKRVLKDNGAIFWNVAQTIREGEVFPLGAYFYEIFKDLGFYLKNWIIWKFEGGETPRSRLFGRYENILWFVKDKSHYIFNLDSVRIPSKWVNDKRCRNEGKNPEDFWIFDERKNSEKLENIKTKLLEIKKRISSDAEGYVNQIYMDEMLRDVEKEIDAILNTKDEIVRKNLCDNIWFINRVVNISKSQKIKHPLTNEAHPCPFPERMIERIIKMSTRPGDLVLDIFNGSGTTCKIAEILGRKWIGMDKELKYCEIAEHRMLEVLNGKDEKLPESNNRSP